MKWWIVLIVLLAWGCQAIKYNVSNRDISKEIKKSPLFENHLTGFSLYDPDGDYYLCNFNDHLSFTPASNTKILTAYACLSSLGDSIATFAYTSKGDTIALTPLGDPSFLHPDFTYQPAAKLLQSKYVQIKKPKSTLSKFGSGWAWDDYEYSYQAERTWFPVYGNVVRIFNTEEHTDSVQVVPSFFTDYTQVFRNQPTGNFIQRDERFNIFNIWTKNDTSTYERKIPFAYSSELFSRLMLDTLNASVFYVDSTDNFTDTLYSQPTLGVIASMLLPSDNFIAEQLLIHCAIMNGLDNVDKYRATLASNWMSFLPDKMRWVDGSGLSRYNLITPRNLIKILERIYDENGWQTIEQVFPIGGVSGTLKNYYKAEKPYVYAKTGTLSNNHNLSGYLKTESGKILIFSFMNNHYLTSSREVKAEMEKLLLKIRDAY